MTWRARMITATTLLFAMQLIHGFIPTAEETEGGSVVGFYGGIGLLLASLVALFGVVRAREWGARLAGITGAIVAVGVVLYHALPFKSPVTNPYLGEPVGIPAWLGVAAAIAAGAWAAWEARAGGAFGPAEDHGSRTTTV
ncbi:MAG TPA: hypothetical protein VM030_09025 [Acidimicrobiales bacterium]|nr:hypothetical protein [Acidimicrobiales bacterium]